MAIFHWPWVPVNSVQSPRSLGIYNWSSRCLAKAPLCMQRVKDNEKDTSNVHGLNLTVALATSPAPAPDKFRVSQQLGNATALQEGPNVSVDVS